MRVSPIAMTVLGMAGSLLGQSPVTMSVSSFMDIFQSGGYNDGSGGSPASAYAFAAAPGQALSFSSVTGSWTCNYGIAQNGPDGTTTACYSTPEAYIPTGPFSGLDLADFQGPLVGMFLEDTLPTSVAPTLRFYDSDSSQGGIATSFAVLNPQIGQVFFIGDGKTGTGTGATQVFNVPATATHVYLAYIDSCSGGDPPGCFFDNEGSLTVTFAISKCAFQVSSVTPQVQLADRAWATQAAIMLSRKTGKAISAAAAVGIADGVAPTTSEFATVYADGGASGCAELDNCSISLSDYINFLQRLGITQSVTSPGACTLAGYLRAYGPMAIVTGTPTANFVHAVVLTGVTGDGVASGAAVNLVDPVGGTVSSQPVQSLFLGIQAAVAAGWPEFVQFP